MKLGALVSHRVAEQQWLPQACVYVILIDPQKRVYVQQRAADKRLWPGLKTVSASGHVNPGEAFKEAAVRELKEELGICVLPREPKEIGAVHGMSHCGPVYELRSAESPNPEAGEVDREQSRFMTADELRDLVMRRSMFFTPAGHAALQLWAAKFEN